MLSILMLLTLAMPPQVPTPPQVPPVVSSWYAIQPEAKRRQANVVVFVGVPVRDVPGFLAAAQRDFPFCFRPAIIVAVNRGEWFERIDLPADATNADIAAALRPPLRQILAPAFSGAFTDNCRT